VPSKGPWQTSEMDKDAKRPRGRHPTKDGMTPWQESMRR